MSIAAYEQKIRDLQRSLADLEGRLGSLVQDTGRLLARNEVFRGISGWDKANAICQEIDGVIARRDKVESYQRQFQQSSLELEKEEKQLKHLDHKYRTVLTEIGSLAYQQYKIGSGMLAQHAAAFAELEALEERMQQRERQLTELQKTSDDGLMSRLRQGTSGLVSRFQNLLEEGRRKSLYHELGLEMVRVGLAQNILARQDPAPYEKFLQDLEGWEEGFRQRDKFRRHLEDLKGNSAETGYPFAATLRDLHRLHAQLEERSQALFRELYRAWKGAGYQPDAEGPIVPLKGQIEDLEHEIGRHRTELEKAELGLKGERLLEEARKNREKGQRLIDEGQSLVETASRQEAEGRSLLERSRA